MSVTAREIHLVSRPGPEGPGLGNFALVTRDLPRVRPGEVRLETIALSLDPYMRARMYEGKNYAAAAMLNVPMVGVCVARVVESRAGTLPVGRVVAAPIGWVSGAVVSAEGLTPIDESLAPATTALGVLGLPGHTGYGGMLRHGRPQPGETVVVSAASGAVGSLAAQVARIKGARVVGIAGGARKCAWLTGDLGLAAAVDHRAPDFAARLAAACPSGIDVYFDNVGGEIFAAALPLMNRGGRIPVCGTIAVDRNQPLGPGPDRMQWLLSEVLVRQLTLRGFLFDELQDMAEEFRRDVSGWIRAGRLVYREEVIAGLENAPGAFLGLFTGANFGKLLVTP